MLYNERIKWMLKQINEKGSIRLTEIAKILDVSESTVRRDINALHNQGLLRRVHGGAISMENKTHFQKNIDPSLPGNTQKQKQSIGEFAATLINHHDTVFIDSGTTTGFMLDHIAARDILAVTDSIGHAKILVSRGVRTIILSGEIHPDSGTAIGPLGVEQLYQMNFDKAFLCTDGYSAKAGFTTEDSYEAKIKRTAVLRATKAFVLADSTKADRIAMTSFASGDEIILITDEISKKNKGLQYLLAKDSKQKI